MADAVAIALAAQRGSVGRGRGGRRARMVRRDSGLTRSGKDADGVAVSNAIGSDVPGWYHGRRERGQNRTAGRGVSSEGVNKHRHARASRCNRRPSGVAWATSGRCRCCCSAWRPVRRGGVAFHRPEAGPLDRSEDRIRPRPHRASPPRGGDRATQSSFVQGKAGEGSGGRNTSFAGRGAGSWTEARRS